MKIFASVRRLGRLFCCLIFALLPVLPVNAAGPATTTIADTVYRADGSAAAGTLVISWPAFTTADGKAVPAGRKTVKIGAQGAVSIPLAPNFGASPEGTYYKVTYKLDDGSTSEEFWSVPAAPSTTISAIRSKLVPANVAVQYATRQYVDSKLAEIGSGGGGGAGNAVQIRGKDVDAAEPLRGQSLVFDGTKYKPQSHPVVDAVADCGATGDGVTDDAAVLQSCINDNPGHVITLRKTAAGPAGTCSFAKTGTLTISSQDTVLMGEGGGLSAGATICQLDDSTAIQISASAVKVKDLFFFGATPWDGTVQAQFVTSGTADCIHAGGPGIDAAQVAIENVLCKSFSRHGFYLDGASGGSVDLWRLTDVRAQNNRGDGFRINGADAGVGACVRCSARLNQGYGFRDTSNNGANSYISPMTDGNHNDAQAAVGTVNITTVVMTNGTATVTTSTNHDFQTGESVVISGNSAAAFNQKWRPITVTSPTTFTFQYTAPNQTGSNGTVGYQPGQRVWVTNSFPGGSYYMGFNPSAPVTLVEAYEEGNQPPGQFGNTANVIGGVLAPMELNSFTRHTSNLIYATNAFGFIQPNNANLDVSLRAGRTNNYQSSIDWYTGGVNAPQAKKWGLDMRSDGITFDIWDYGVLEAPVVWFDGANANIRPQGAAGELRLNQSVGSGGLKFYGGGASVVAAVDSTGKGTFNGGLTTPAQIASTVATGTAPLIVTSTTPVANLTLASDTQLPSITTPGKVQASALPSHTHAAADVDSGTLAAARLGSGAANNSTCLHGDSTWSSCGGGYSPGSFYQTSNDASGAAWTPTANGTRGWGFYLPYPVTFTNLVFNISAADTGTSTYTCNHVDSGAPAANVNCYSFGIYDNTGSLKAHFGPFYAATTGNKDKAAVEGTVTLPAGQYVMAITGTATTAAFGNSTLSNGRYTWCGNQNLSTVTSNGALAGNTFGNPPCTTSWGVVGVPFLVFHN